MVFDPAWADAIGSIESSGRYGILGPVTRSGDRAYGKYQVMGANVGPWTKEVLGKALTPDQFLANPQAQDAVFAAKFGQAVDRYGNPQDAASVWFTGKPLAQGANRADMLGTTGAGYVAKFNKALGTPDVTNPALPPSVVAASNPVPQQQASLSPQQQSPSSFPVGLFQPQPAPYSPPSNLLTDFAMNPPPSNPLMAMNAPQQAQMMPMRRPLDLSGLASLLQSAPAPVRGLVYPGIA